MRRFLPAAALAALAAAAAVSAAAEPGGWVRVVAGERATILVERSSLSRRGPVARFRMRVVARRPQQGIGSILADAEVDCRTRTGTLLAAAWFDPSGAPASAPPGLAANGRAQPVPADIPEAAQLYARICRAAAGGSGR